MGDSRLDEHGHLASRLLPDGRGIAGVIELHGREVGGVTALARLVYARSGDPSRGYDRVWWYDTTEHAMEVMGSWHATAAPPGFLRDMHKEPISIPEEG